jgi:YD repeat-containing protein
VPIAGQRASQYTLIGADVNHTVRADVRARNAFGAESATSAPTIVVTAPFPAGTAPANTRAPRITGTPEVGTALDADPGGWTGTQPISTEIMWQRCDGASGGCAPIAAATASRYVLTGADLDHTIRIFVRARNLLGEAVATSAPSARVTLPEPVTTVTYAHDADGRLVGAFDGDGAGVEYVYDANNNLTSVRRLAHDVLAVVAATPLSGTAGQRVTVFGTGLTANTKVSFDGELVSPLAVRRNRIVVAAPASVRSGALRVVDASASAPAGTFRVTPSAPTITAVSPLRVNEGDTITVTGTGFAAAPQDNVLSIGGTRAVVETATTTSLTVKAPPFRPAGRLTVRTLHGSGSSSQDVAAAPSPYTAADIDRVDRLPVGSATLLEIATANKVSLGLVDVAGGQRLTFELSGATFTDCATVKIFAPGSRIMDRQTVCQNETTLTTPVLAPSAATYAVLLDPDTGSTGSVTVTPRIIGEDVRVRATIDGPEATATTTAGRRAVFLIQAPANRRVHPVITTSSYDACVAMELQTPSGAALVSNSCAGALDPITLPVRGDYRLGRSRGRRRRRAHDRRSGPDAHDRPGAACGLPVRRAGGQPGLPACREHLGILP